MKKIKDFLRKVFDNLLMGLGLLGLLLFLVGLGFRGRYQDVSETYWPMAIVGAIVLIPYVTYYIYYKNKVEKQQGEIIKEQKNDFDQFLNSSKEMVLNFNDVEIILFNSKNPGFYDSIVGEDELKENQMQNRLNEVLIQFLLNGNEINYMFQTYKGLDNLKIHFAIKKETILSFNESDCSQVYIDFDFLES